MKKEREEPIHCPFCGKPGIILVSGDGIGKTYKTPYVYFPSCTDSRCLGRNMRKHYPTREEAVRSWNTRY